MESSILILLSSAAVASARDLILGSSEGRVFYDRQLYAEPAFWRQVSDVTIETSPFEVVSRLEITDLRPDKRGEAVLINGGVGSRFVTVQLRSPSRLRGFNFRVQVFAEPSDDYDVMDENADSIRFLRFLKKARNI